MREQYLTILPEDPGFQKKPAEKQAEELRNARLSADLSSLALAYVDLRLGKPADAFRRYEKTLNSRREAHRKLPNDFHMIHNLANACVNYAMALHWNRQLEKARTLLTESLASYVKASRIKSSNNFKRNKSLGHYRLGALLSDLGEEEASIEQFEKCHQLRCGTCRW